MGLTRPGHGLHRSTTGGGTPAEHSGPAVRPAYPLYEVALTTALMFAVVTLVRWLMAPGSTLLIADVHIALWVVGGCVGAVLLLLILSSWGRRSGAHMNPAVSVALLLT